MSKAATIYAKIARVMDEVSIIPKNGYNKHFGYNYVKEEDLVEMLRPILVKHGLVFIPNVVEQQRNGELTKVNMEFTLADVDTGEVVKSNFWGEGQDKNDKGLYKAYTGATKYFLMKTFQSQLEMTPKLEKYLRVKINSVETSGHHSHRVIPKGHLKVNNRVLNDHPRGNSRVMAKERHKANLREVLKDSLKSHPKISHKVKDRLKPSHKITAMKSSQVG